MERYLPEVPHSPFERALATEYVGFLSAQVLAFSRYPSHKERFYPPHKERSYPSHNRYPFHILGEILCPTTNGRIRPSYPSHNRYPSRKERSYPPHRRSYPPHLARRTAAHRRAPIGSLYRNRNEPSCIFIPATLCNRKS